MVRRGGLVIVESWRYFSSILFSINCLSEIWRHRGEKTKRVCVLLGVMIDRDRSRDI